MSVDVVDVREEPRDVPERFLSVRDLRVHFPTDDGLVKAVDGLSFDVERGQTLGIVGESGSGKSVTSQAIFGLHKGSRARVSGEIWLNGQELVAAHESQMRSLRGQEMAMIFQDPLSAMHPFYTVGAQISEAYRVHNDVSRKAARQRVVEMLDRVGIPDPDKRYDDYPHQFSGGMRQRAMIAMALICSPSLLIADEPTTALDVTIQAQIMDVLRAAQRDANASLVLITHDLGLIAEMADRVVVMYAGHVVESGDVETIFARPRHPYTVGLLASLPQTSGDEKWLRPIPGTPPDLAQVPPGCPFHPRCQLSRGRDRCRTEMPVLRAADAPDHLSACHFSDELARTGAPT